MGPHRSTPQQLPFILDEVSSTHRRRERRAMTASSLPSYLRPPAESEVHFVGGVMRAGEIVAATGPADSREHQGMVARAS
jgi:hypothetical protein